MEIFGGVSCNVFGQQHIVAVSYTYIHFRDIRARPFQAKRRGISINQFAMRTTFVFVFLNIFLFAKHIFFIAVLICLGLQLYHTNLY